MVDATLMTPRATYSIALVLAATVVGGCGKNPNAPTQPLSTSPPVFELAWGSLGSGDGQFNTPWGVAVDQVGNVYVADTDNHRVQKFTATGGHLATWSCT